jgi:16S rRNA (adenine1518-N6/adenine1519-N6)-dimethyltransferase
MVSNLPYQAGTRILLELVQRHDIPSMTVLVQTEVAERLAAKEGSKTRGLAGVWAQLDYDVKIVRKVAASCFWPRPEIGSSVVTLTRHDRNVGFSAKERDVFHRLTKKAFEHRRKQLGSIFKDLIQSSARAEELANEDWINLSKGIAENEDA